MFSAIFIPDFPLEAIVHLRPELREQPLAVVDGTPPVIRVIAVNEKAEDADVETGMTKLQAEERLCACNGLLLARSPEREQAAHAALLDCACGFSPRVEDTAADTVVLDLAGLERVFGPAAKMGRDIAARCAQIGLEANVAVASNADAAMHAARGFSGITVIPPGKEEERLGSLPVDVLAACVGDPSLALDDARAQEILDTLDRWGVRTLRALAALPEVAITERLGQAGLYWQRLARGATSRTLRLIEPPLTFEESAEMDYPVDLLEPLSFVLNRMLEQLCARLAARALATNELQLTLELEPTAEDVVIGSPDAGDSAARGRSPDRQITRLLRLPVAMLDAKVFLKLLQLDLKSHPPNAPVIKVGLAAKPAEPRRAQSGLFLPSAPEPERLEVTVARIANIVEHRASAGNGADAAVVDGRSEPRVGSPEILDTHRPDAFRMNKFVPPLAGEAGSSRGKHSRTIAASRIFRPPLAARVAVREGRPARLECVQASGDVQWAAGPWRNSGEWWTEGAWSREEWDVSVEDVLYRIYHDHDGWFVECCYD